MRGKDLFDGEQPVYTRITPAYAGKSNCISLISSFTEDHPRLCGEKYLILFSNISYQGSPPPMRGKAPIWYNRGVKTRITPAYAGKSKIEIIC